MSLEVRVQQLVGRVVGGVVEEGTPANVAHDIDEIHVKDVKGEWKRVGFCPHADGSPVRFVRILTDEQRTEIRDEVARQRKERGLSTSELTSQPPDPREIRKLVKKGQ